MSDAGIHSQTAVNKSSSIPRHSPPSLDPYPSPSRFAPSESASIPARTTSACGRARYSRKHGSDHKLYGERLCDPTELLLVE